MHSQLAQRLRRSSISAVPPPPASSDYSKPLADLAEQILYKSPLPSNAGLPIFILNAAAFPDAKETDYDSLLPYVLARLPGEDELIGGKGYEVVFFAGGGGDGPTAVKKGRPGLGWFVQAYNVLTRASRKRLQKLYIVHERSWVRVLVEMFSSIVSPKFRKKIYHVSPLTRLAILLPIEDLLIPISAYLHDRRLSPDIHSPYVTGRRAFSAPQPFPKSRDGQLRTPRVLRESTKFMLMEKNIVTEGIFRIPPHSKTLEILREAYDRGQKFIIWKEGDVILPQRSHRFAEDFIEDIHLRDGYGIHLAAGIIKLWYRELRDPLIPQTAYSELENVFGDEKSGINPERLVDLISIDSHWSSLPTISRLVLNTHLLPLLSSVEARKTENKMTALNLAVCFAPTLICGPDPMQDIKIGAILRRILEVAIEQWDKGLREVCGFEARRFEQSLLDPPEESDYEDPLLGERRPLNMTSSSPFGESTTTQLNGIILEDREIGAGSEAPPALPPRPAASNISQPAQRQGSDDSSVRRKPAPPLTVPPRYSMAIGENNGVENENAPRYSLVMAQDAMASDSPISYATTTDGFNPTRETLPENDTKTDVKETESATESAKPALTLRKALTSEQMINVNNGLLPVIRKRHEDYKADCVDSQHQSDSESSASGNRDTSQTRQPPVVPAPFKSRPISREKELATSSSTNGIRKSSADTFVKPNWPASARSASTPISTSSRKGSSNAPNILNLAKPILPASNTHPGRAVDRSPTIPTPVFAHTRAPSPGLSERYKPPGTLQRAQSDIGPRGGRLPQRLKLGAGSVEDLRRIYEDRLGAVDGLAQAGQQKTSPTN